MKEHWKEQMKQKLEGHKMSPPAGLWEGISQEMGLESEAATKKSSKSFVRWYWAVAAVVLALVGFFALYQFDDNEPKVIANNESKTVPSNPVEEKPGEAESPEETLMVDKPSLLALASNNTEVETSIEETTDETQYETIVENQQTTPEEIKAETNQPKQTYLPDVIDPNTTAFQSEYSSRWSLGLAGSTGLLLANNSDSQPLYLDQSHFNGIDNANSYKGNNDKYSKTEIVSKHNIPLRFGISLQYQLNDRFALYSGISFTYLKSEISLPFYNNISYDQKLSYLGIPLGISWHVWFTEHMSIYLSGGTMIEKCVSAEITEGKLDSHPWQWSVNASVGAEYKIIRQLGIYLEPSLGYYFDDGTSLEHYYKEHPLAPSILFGLRFHLK